MVHNLNQGQEINLVLAIKVVIISSWTDTINIEQKFTWYLGMYVKGVMSRVSGGCLWWSVVTDKALHRVTFLA